MLSLRQKLILSYLLLILITLAVSSYSALGARRVRHAIDIIFEDNNVNASAAQAMHRALQQEEHALGSVIAGERQQGAEELLTSQRALTDQLAIARAGKMDVQQKNLLDALDKNNTEANAAANALLTHTDSSAATLSHLYFETTQQKLSSVDDDINMLLSLDQQRVAAARDRASRQARRELAATLIFSALGIALALFFATEFTLSAIRPLIKLTRGAKLIGEGDLEQRIEVRSRDEIGVLATEFNRMAVRLRELRESTTGRLMLERGLSDAVLQSIFEPVIVTDSSGEVLKLNRAANDLLGESAGDPMALATTPGGDKILQAVKDAVIMQRPVAHEGEAAILPLRFRNLERSFRLRTTPIRDEEGKLLGAVTVLEDVTELRDLDRFKTRFLSVASQKLREPLKSLRISLYTLSRGFGGDLRPLQEEILEDAEQRATALDELMTDLIELAELDSGVRQLTLERMRPIDMVRQATERFQAEARSRRIELNYRAFPDLSYVSVDRRAQRSVLDNLLSNALRFTPEAGMVVVEAEERKDHIQFYVRDTGRGIETDRLPGIFGRFNSQGGGTGLGLALVRRLVESMGGQISVESRMGAGTTFTFTLPTAATRAPLHPVEIG